MQKIESAAEGGGLDLPSARQLLGDLNELLRRFLQYKGEAEWASILLDGASRFCSPVALFSVRNGQLALLGARGRELPSDLTMNAGETPAFENALLSSDVVVTLRTVREVGAALAGEGQSGRAYLIPISNGSRVAAVLFAAESTDTNMRAVELVGGMASLILQRQANAGTAMQIAAAAKDLSFGGKPASKARDKKELERKIEAFANLSDEERSVRLRARRMARVKVAEMQLSRPDAARAGREQSNVYLFLKNEIDAARESYQAQYGQHRRMEDYLHIELVRLLGDGDEEKLGEEYPGQLD